jgi:hypothetical protein
MARVCRGRAIAIIGSPVRISIGPSLIGGPIARIAEIFSRPSALAAAIAVEVRMRRRAAAAGSCTPQAAVQAHSVKKESEQSSSSATGCAQWGSHLGPSLPPLRGTYAHLVPRIRVARLRCLADARAAGQRAVLASSTVESSKGRLSIGSLASSVGSDLGPCARPRRPFDSMRDTHLTVRSHDGEAKESGLSQTPQPAGTGLLRAGDSSWFVAELRSSVTSPS